MVGFDYLGYCLWVATIGHSGGSMSDSLILCCSCFKMDKKAVEAFSLIYPDREVPRVVKGRDNIHKLSKSMGPSGEHIKALSKITGRFAYYVKIEGGKIMEEYDLLRGKRIA